MRIFQAIREFFVGFSQSYNGRNISSEHIRFNSNCLVRFEVVQKDGGRSVNMSIMQGEEGATKFSFTHSQLQQLIEVLNRTEKAFAKPVMAGELP